MYCPDPEFRPDLEKLKREVEGLPSQFLGIPARGPKQNFVR
jgi:hypothetical protein